MELFKTIIASAIVGVVFTIISFFINRSVFKAIDTLNEQVREIFVMFRKEIPTKEDCKEESVCIDKINIELNLHGKQLSGYGARLLICEKNIEKLQER